jgi:hypothetical protein
MKSIFCLSLVLFLFVHKEGFCKDRPIKIEHDTIVDTTIVVPENVTCIIKPGVTIRFSGYHQFIVHGLLIAEGKPGKQILITSVDRILGSAEKPCWQGFDIRENADAVFRYCRIEGAFKNTVFKSKPVFEACEFVGNHYAVYCVNKAAAHVKKCKIYRNKILHHR